MRLLACMSGERSLSLSGATTAVLSVNHCFFTQTLNQPAAQLCVKKLKPIILIAILVDFLDQVLQTECWKAFAIHLSVYALKYMYNIHAVWHFLANGSKLHNLFLFNSGQ